MTAYSAECIRNTILFDWWSYKHIINALIVMTLVYIHDRGSQIRPCSPIDWAQVNARTLFLKGSTAHNEVIRKTAQQCLRLLEALCSAAATLAGKTSGRDAVIALQSLVRESKNMPEQPTQSSEPAENAAAARTLDVFNETWPFSPSDRHLNGSDSNSLLDQTTFDSDLLKYFDFDGIVTSHEQYSNFGDFDWLVQQY